MAVKQNDSPAVPMRDVWKGDADKEGHQFEGSLKQADSLTRCETMDFRNDLGYDNAKERIIAIAKRSAEWMAANVDRMPPFGKDNQIVVTVSVKKP